MKKLFTVALALGIALSGCQDKSKTTLEKKVVELEKLNKAKDKKILTLAVTVNSMAQDLSHFDHSGIYNFFAENDFWQNTYEVDPSAQCCANCAKNDRIAVSHCQTLTDSTQKAACMRRSYQELIACTGACP